MQKAQDILPVGSLIGGSGRDRYIVESVLGKGGFSIIYRVRDQRVRQNIYALKAVIDPDARERDHVTFEYELLTRIDHPSLPRVYRVFEDGQNKRVYVLMDYIEGTDLGQIRKKYFQQRMALPRVLDVMAPIVEAISFLHRQNPPIVHRDIKPSNIILPSSGEKAYLVDFGAAKVYDSDATTAAVRHCSPGYAAPEQYAIGTTPLTDIYGLGATFYNLLSGKAPVDALQRMVQINERGADPLEPLHELVPSLPRSVADAVHRAMSPRRNDRFETVEEFWQAVSSGRPLEEGFASPSSSLAEAPPGAAAEGADEPPQASTAAKHETFHVISGKKRFRIILSLSIVLVLICVAGVGMAAWYFTRIPARPSSQQTLGIPRSTSVTFPPTTSPYPPLAGQYTGTISDVVANSSNAMSLSNIQERAGTIRGSFVGLGLAGTFTGTISTNGQIRFRVPIFGGSETLVFEGNIKLGGSIAGSYRILNRNNEFTGEYGLWSISPAR